MHWNFLHSQSYIFSSSCDDNDYDLIILVLFILVVACCVSWLVRRAFTGEGRR